MKVIGSDGMQDFGPAKGVEFSHWIRRTAVALLLLLVLFPLFVMLAPWQQNVTGRGQVVAYNPIERPQEVQAPVKGRVAEVYVIEAQEVKKGDPLVRLVDIDPEKVKRLEAQLEAKRKDLELTQGTESTFSTQLGMLTTARDLAVEGFKARVQVAQESLRAAKEKLRAEQAEQEFAVQEETAKTRLAPEFVSQLAASEAIAKRKKADAAVAAAQAGVDAATAALENAQAELGRNRETAGSSMEAARAKMQSAGAKVASLQADIAKLEGELRAQNTQLVVAPQDGRVFRLAVNTTASIVKEGQVLLQVVPDTPQLAVELFMRGLDWPLIERLKREREVKVRLQFEGWPAVQFVGWPSFAVGTFGGIVKLVDPTDSGSGRFRVLVLPDPDDKPWQDENLILRQGVRTKGWVLLRQVPLWWEIWRQLNGFPPAIEEQPAFEGPGALK